MSGSNNYVPLQTKVMFEIQVKVQTKVKIIGTKCQVQRKMAISNVLLFIDHCYAVHSSQSFSISYTLGIIKIIVCPAHLNI